jgi:hypothetical protein
MIDKAILSLRPNSQWTLHGENYTDLEWLDDSQTKPTEQQIAAEIVRLQAEYKTKQYQRDRAVEYPPLAEQLDMLWHAMEQDPTKRLEPFYSSIKDIKDAYPK